MRLEVMTEAYYYADENSQPVGPLSLEEIRKIASAGVIPHDVMVCEAGGKHWESLEVFDLTGPGEEPTSVETSDCPPSAGLLKLFFWLALLASLASFGLDAVSTRAAIENEGIDPQAGRESLVIIVSLLALGLSLVLIYQIVSAIPSRFRATSPVKAAGFYLIPVFSLFWVFRLFLGLVDSYRKWSSEVAPSEQRRLANLVPIAAFAAFLVMAGEILLYVDGFGMFENYDGVNAKRVYLLVYLGYAAGEAAFFHFFLSGVHIVSRFLNPEELHGPSEKRRGFLSAESSLWKPVYFVYAFLLIAISVWR